MLDLAEYARRVWLCGRLSGACRRPEYLGRHHFAMFVASRVLRPYSLWAFPKVLRLNSIDSWASWGPGAAVLANCCCCSCWKLCGEPVMNVAMLATAA